MAKKRKEDYNIMELSRKSANVQNQRYMSRLSDQIKATMKTEDIQKNKFVVNRVRQSENITRQSLDSHWHRKVNIS